MPKNNNVLSCPNIYHEVGVVFSYGSAPASPQHSVTAHDVKKIENTFKCTLKHVRNF